MQFALRAKQAIRKVTAIAAGTVMLGATVGSAAAYTLADYPAPFVKDGKYNLLPVYGAVAMGDDISGAWDILAGLSTSATATGTGGTGVSVTGGTTDEVPLNVTLSSSGYFSSQLTDSDISTLQDTTVTFKGSSYDIHDELVLGTINSIGTDNITLSKAPRLETSLSSGDDDYEGNVYLEIPEKKTVDYRYVFDEAIKLNDTSTSDPLEIEFLGKHLKVIEINSNTKFTAYVGDEYFMNVGDKVTALGKTVTLDNVGQSAVLVDVDGVKATIQDGNTRTVNSVEITVDELFYRTQLEQSSASLVVGKDSSEAISNGDYYSGGDDICTNNNPEDPDCWKWVLGELRSNVFSGNIQTGETQQGPTIGIESNFVWDDVSDNPAGMGECVNLPNNYLSICYDSNTVADTKYQTLAVEYETGVDFSSYGGSIAGTSEKAIKIETPGSDEGLVVKYSTSVFQNRDGKFTGDKKTDTIYLHTTNNATAGGRWLVDVWYEDSDNKVQYAGAINVTDGMAGYTGKNFAEVNYDDTKSTNIALDLVNTTSITIKNTSNTLALQFDVIGDESAGPKDNWDDLLLELKHAAVTGLAAPDFTGFGATAETAETRELRWATQVAGRGNKSIGKKDEDHRGFYGYIIKDPESGLDSDKLELSIPGDQVLGNIVIKGQSGVVSSGGGGAITDKAPPMVKDVEVTRPEADNLLLVGGPVVNKITARFIGSTWNYKPGEAIIELKDNGANVALVVAGTDAVDTRRASRVLRDYKNYKTQLVGKAVKVTGTSATFTDTVVASA